MEKPVVVEAIEYDGTDGLYDPDDLEIVEYQLMERLSGGK